MFDPGPSITIPPMVSVFTRGVGWVDESIAASAPSSAAWQGNYDILYYPIILPAGCVVRRMWWVNGATADSNPVEAGIYADDGDAKPGARIVYAHVDAQTGTNTVEFADVTDTALAPGRYWLALFAQTTTATFFRSSLNVSSGARAPYGYYENVGPLAATASPVEWGIGGAIYLFGFSTTTSP